MQQYNLHMRRARLHFANTYDVWDFIVLTGSTHVEVANNTLYGFFSDEVVETARVKFGAEVYNSAPLSVSLNPDEYDTWK